MFLLAKELTAVGDREESSQRKRWRVSRLPMLTLCIWSLETRTFTLAKCFSILSFDTIIKASKSFYTR